MLNAGLKALRKLLRPAARTPPDIPPQPSLNEKILAFIDRNKHRSLPNRETTLLPEILVPCYNHARYLPEMLDLVQECGVPMTVIDDRSDEPDRMLIEAMGRQRGVKVIRNDASLRQWGSLNKAIGMSENNLFIVANADDYLLPGWVRYAIRQFQEHDISLLGGMNICFFNHFPQSEHHFVRLLKMSASVPSSGPKRFGPDDARTFAHDNSINMTMTGCTFVRSAWEFVGGFYAPADRVSPHDDRDFQMRVCGFFPVGVSDELSALWRSNSSNGLGTS